MRRNFIEMAQRRACLGTGSARAMLRERTAVVRWIDFTPILAPVRWAVVGAAATRLYMPERATQDMDIAIAAEDAAIAREKLRAAGFTYLQELGIGGSAWRSPDGQIVDVLEMDSPWWLDALERAQSNRDAQGLPVTPLPHLILMKFQAGRVQDLADVSRMLGQADDAALEEARALFRRYAPDDVEDLESLIVLGRMEHE